MTVQELYHFSWALPPCVSERGKDLTERYMTIFWGDILVFLRVIMLCWRKSLLCFHQGPSSHSVRHCPEKGFFSLSLCSHAL